MKLLIALIASALFVSACSLQQDPLAGSGSQVNSGNLPNTNKPVAKRPLPKDYLQLDFPPQIQGRVGAPIEFKISGRILAPDVPFNIEIDNLDVYAGATFDATTGMFSWTPTRAVMSNNMRMTFPLIVTMYSQETATSSVQSEQWILNMVVEMNPTKPVITYAKIDPVYISGDSYRIPITVDDLDARDRSDIRVVPADCPSSVSYSSLAGFLEIQKSSFNPTASTPGRYEGAAVLNLKRTSGMSPGRYCFGFYAYSYVGLQSDLYTQTVTFEAELQKAKIVVDSDIDINIGEKKTLFFTVYEPTGVANLVVDSMTDIAALMPGSTVQCDVKTFDKSMAYCQANLDATQVTDQRTHRIEVRTYTVSRNDGNRKMYAINAFRINVKKVVTP